MAYEPQYADEGDNLPIMSPEEAQQAGAVDDDLPVLTPEQARQMGAVSDDDLPVMTPEQARKAGAVESGLQAESGPGTAARKLAHSVPTLIASLPAMSAGMQAGAALGAFGGPAAWATVPAGALVGGAAAGLGAGYVLDHAFDYIKEKLGVDDREQRAVNAKEHYGWDLGADVASTFAAFNVGKGAQLLNRGINAGVMGALEGGQQIVQGEFDPVRLTAMTLSGGVAVNPNRIGKAGLGLGERFVRPSTPTPPPGAPGVSAEHAPPIETVDVGNPQSAPVRSSRNGAKETVEGGAPTEVRRGSVFDDPAVLDSLEAMRNKTAMEGRDVDETKVPYDGTKPGETGLSEENQKAIAANEARQAEIIAELEATKEKMKAAETPEAAGDIAVQHLDDLTTRATRDAPHELDATLARKAELEPKVREEAADIWQKAQAEAPVEPVSKVTAPVTETEPPIGHPQRAQWDFIGEPPPGQVKTWDPATGAIGVYTPEVKPPTPGTTAKVPFMVTAKMRADLTARGFTPEQVRSMTPAQAHENLRAAEPTRREQIEAGRPAEAEAVQNRQGVINKAAAALPENVAKQLLTLPKNKQADAGARAFNTANLKTGKISTDTRLRHPEVKKALEVDGLGVEAGTIGEAKTRTRSVESTQSVFEAATPTAGEDKAALRARLLKALAAAKELNDGKNPVAKAAEGGYQPKKHEGGKDGTPKDWYWLKEAQTFVKSRMSQAQIDKFLANEKLLRGTPEDVEVYRQGKRVESDIALNRHTGDEVVAAKKQDVFDVDAAEGVGVKREIKNSDDLSRPEVLKENAEKTAKIEEDLIKLADSEPVTTYKMDEGPEKAAQNRARLVKESEGTKAALENQRTSGPLETSTKEKARALREKLMGKGPKKEPIDDPAKPQTFIDEVTKNLKHFKSDESGGIDITRVKEAVARTADAVYPTSFLRKVFSIRTNEYHRIADNIFAEKAASTEKLNAERTAATYEHWYAWMKGATKDEMFRWVYTLERTKSKDSNGQIDRAKFAKELEDNGIKEHQLDWMSRQAPFFRETLDKQYAFEKLWGSKADFRDNYFMHLFERPDEAKKFFDDKIRQHGATWFQKNREFDTVADAVKNGHKLKYDNPIDMLNARLRAGTNSAMMVASLRKLEEKGHAFPAKSASAGIKHNWVELPPTPDRQTWYIRPEMKDIFNNAFDPKSFWDNGVPKTIRGVWMQIKTVWVPIELAISSFHLTHIIANINPWQNMTRALRVAYHDPKSAPGEIGRAIKWSLEDPVLSLPLDKIGLGLGKALDNLTGNAFSQYRGRRMYDLADVPTSQMSQQDRVVDYLQKLGGWSPKQSAEDLIHGKKAWEKAWHDKSLMMIPAGIRYGVEKLQEPLFKYMIPALKNVAWIRDVEAALKIKPDLIHDEGRLQSVLREISKNIDDRYGEMFYKGLFINKTLKDTGIMSMLSMGWNTGLIRQPVGAVTGAVKQGLVATGMKQVGPRELAAMQLDDKLPFVGMYIGGSMLSGALLTYTLTGKWPTEWVDYFWPKTGLTNPDGRPGRLGTPFQTREGHMLAGHAEEYGGGMAGWIKGGLALLWNKMILSPLVDLYNNKDFYGRDLYDTHAPMWKQLLQALDSTLGKNLYPISMSGADRAEQLGGGTREKALAYAGFGPAPSYIENTPIQNALEHAARRYHKPEASPYEYGEKTGAGRGLVQGLYRKAMGDKLTSEVRNEARPGAQLADQRGDSEAAAKWRQILVEKGGMSPKSMAKQRPGDKDQYNFSVLPIDEQVKFIDQMSKPERVRYVMENHKLNGVQRAKLVSKVPILNNP